MKNRNVNLLPEFVLCVGPMWSGKTTKLVSIIERYGYQNSVAKNICNPKIKIACFKPLSDSRYSNDKIVTHSGLSIDAIPVKSVDEIVEFIKNEKPNIVAVDEAFMIEGLSSVLIEAYWTGISIYVSSIDLLANLEPCKEIAKMMPYATKIIKCTSVCESCGNDAHYTSKKVSTVNEITVGGADIYKPSCLYCHAEYAPLLHLPYRLR